MQWNNTGRGQLPTDNDEVLILVNGVNYIARYDASKQVFRVQDEPIETFFRVQDVHINWAEQ